MVKGTHSEPSISSTLLSLSTPANSSQYRSMGGYDDETRSAPDGQYKRASGECSVSHLCSLGKDGLVKMQASEQGLDQTISNLNH